MVGRLNRSQPDTAPTDPRPIIGRGSARPYPARRLGVGGKYPVPASNRTDYYRAGPAVELLVEELEPTSNRTDQ